MASKLECFFSGKFFSQVEYLLRAMIQSQELGAPLESVLALVKYGTNLKHFRQNALAYFISLQCKNKSIFIAFTPLLANA